MGQKKSKSKWSNTQDTLPSAQLQSFAAQLSVEIKGAFKKQRDEFMALLDENTEHIGMIDEELKLIKLQNGIIDGRITRVEKTIEDLREQLLRAEARTMRDNLVFYNIPESFPEDTEMVLRDFLAKEMIISEFEMRYIQFDGVHRVGPQQERKHRVIVAKFNPGVGKDIVLEHVNNLNKEKKFVVTEHLPRELEERKRQLWHKYDEAKQHGKDVRWSLDKLVIENKVTQIRRDTVAYIDVNTTEIAAGIYVHHAPTQIHNHDGYQGHIVAITNQAEVVPALHAIYADLNSAKANHNIYAYRLTNEGKLIEHYEDDGYWGGGRYLLKLMREYEIMDTLLCVSRWCKGLSLGKSQFGHITDAARVALETAEAEDYVPDEYQEVAYEEEDPNYQQYDELAPYDEEYGEGEYGEGEYGEGYGQ